jgi:hypothetical protein
MKVLDPVLALCAVGVGIGVGSLYAYHHEQNELNRKAYYECLRVTEEIAKADNQNGIRIVSTPTCRLP